MVRSAATPAAQAPQDEVCQTLMVRSAATPAAQAPQDEVCQTLMVRSAATPRVSNHEATGCAIMVRHSLPLSQLPRIRKRERRHPPGVLVEDQAARDRRFGALGAIFS